MVQSSLLYLKNALVKVAERLVLILSTCLDGGAGGFILTQRLGTAGTIPALPEINSPTLCF